MGNAAQKQCCSGSAEDTNEVPGKVGMATMFGTEECLESVEVDPSGAEKDALPAVGAAGGKLEAQPTKNGIHTTLGYQDGSSYVGQMVSGRREGHGVFTSTDAERYEGQWQADRQHGAGEQKWSDGRSYVGQFKDGRFSGRGKMAWQTDKGPMLYDGEYQDDVKHGSGKFVWPDGHSYEGQWSRGKRHGRGAYQNVRGERKVGHWADDRFLRWETDGVAEDSVNVILK